MKNIAIIAISNTTREFDRQFHYLINEKDIDRVIPGVRVIVPFGRADRHREGYVLGITDTSDFNELKEIAEVVDERPVLNDDLLQLASWMKNKYMCTLSDALRCMLPSGTGVSSTSYVKLLRYEELPDKAESAILSELMSTDRECELDLLKSKLNIKTFNKVLKKLEENGNIAISEEYSSKVKDKKVKVAFLALPREEIIEEINSSRIRKIQHIRVLEMLLENEFLSVADIIRFSSSSAGVVNTLKKYGYIDFKDIEIHRDPVRNRNIKRTVPLEPSPQQEYILKNIKEKLDKGIFAEFLIHGVTGSGKTEVYLQLIKHCLDSGKQAIVLVPEISLTPQMVERFIGRFGNDVAVLHSRLSPGERYDQWKLVKDGRINVVVGARSAVFAPVGKPGIIIIDEEHENSYKSETMPKYNAPDIARERCRYHNAVLLSGSATPSVETYFRALSGITGLYNMTERANKLLLPSVETIDMRKELDEGNRSIFSRKLTAELKKNIEQDMQTILFLNRRGYSSFVICRKCGFTMKCSNCDISLTYHAHDERLICHYCGYTVINPEICPKCKSNYIRFFGTGTQKVEDEIKKQFPGCSVIRMDLDTTSRKNSHEDILKAFRDKNINVLVGTQMIAKGHDFPNVTLVGVLAADSLLNSGDYRSSERTFQLLTQVAGRAGRGEFPGRVIIQAYNTEDFSIRAALTHDYISFYKSEIKIREKLVYPPFTNLAVIIVSDVNDNYAMESAKQIKAELEKLFEGLTSAYEILGPAHSPLSRIKNKFRWRIIIKCNSIDAINLALTRIQNEYSKKRTKASFELSVDINPANML